MALINALSSLSLASAPRTSGVGFKKSVASFVVSPPKVSGSASARGVLHISCKQNKKARALQSVQERLYNKARKSEITTRMKKVFVKASALKEGACTEEDIGALETLISEATKAVDKAVAKGVLHKNTGARRKARMSKYKHELRKEKGLMTA
ncbi:uncharacterized protein MICPUCDRAFT_29322 [Micromonas pusilla CCMP1545]|uniref:Predicted protein n=1 Tax=Micromonas pusilla (strain CCMP1545) TaxID=564608 RepID=C1N464_MICPC|nr:uncharacterized protein MICPUCDRAFT_29322 [Micromonas pusilla CCMP1545]EEH53313.1 predicted protein [Micromonas pusilla CCMP1545]|eukprot:XP_003062494.1 predicted protein [Micromonas pusilla CCMP1545]